MRQLEAAGTGSLAGCDDARWQAESLGFRLARRLYERPSGVRIGEISVETSSGSCGAAGSGVTGHRWTGYVGKTAGLIDSVNPGSKEASHDPRGAYTGRCSGDSHQEGC